MANPIQLKRSTTAGNTPSSLAQGEVAINIPDRLAFVADGGGTVRQFNLTSDAEKVASGAIATALNGKLSTAGGTITGPLSLNTRLSGTFSTSTDTPFFNISSSESGYTAGGGAGAFYIPQAWIHSMTNPVGHRELLHYEIHSTGAAQGKFVVGATFIAQGHAASGGGTSSGSLFGTNSVALVDAGVSSSLEASAAEFNTVVKANITRKTGIQVVDAPGSSGTGSAIDTAVLLGKGDSTAVGYNNGIQFGAQGDTNQFPVKGTMILSDFGTCTYGIDLRRTSLSGSQALLLNATHSITWAGGTGGAITNNGALSNGPQIIFGNGLLITGRNDGSPFLVQDIAGATVRPGADANVALGAGSFRFSTVYAATGTINTSDGELKRDRGEPSDALLDAIGSVRIASFQHLDAIAEKGEDGARIHYGVIAQEVRDALIAHGLDPARQGFWCSDDVTEEFEETYEADVPVLGPANAPVGGDESVETRKETLTRTATRPVLGADGKPVQRLGIRYDEFSMLLHAWTQRELKRLFAAKT